jgi:hypothetical protein
MDPLATNPFAILTFIVAPAILTNASSIMALGTSNRFARAIDRARILASQVEGKGPAENPEIALRARQLGYAKRRVLYLVRALTSFYISVGAFAAAALLSLLGAVTFFAEVPFLRQVMPLVVLCAGVAGVGGLVSGATLLVFETRLAVRVLTEETQFWLKHRSGETEL